MKYICLLRGINVGGHNKVVMSELRSSFEQLGFSNVRTYINSGNVLFESDINDRNVLIDMIENRLAQDFVKLDVTVVSKTQLETNFRDAPQDWGHDETRKHNLLFVRPPATAADVMNAIEVSKPAIETVTAGEGVVYWSASLVQFGQTASSRLAGNPIYKKVTVRNYNTSIKLFDLLQ